jgi:hypothetical protein
VTWRRVKTATIDYLTHPLGWSIVKVPCCGKVRYELYGQGRYHGWHESPGNAQTAFEQLAGRA